MRNYDSYETFAYLRLELQAWTLGHSKPFRLELTYIGLLSEGSKAKRLVEIEIFWVTVTSRHFTCSYAILLSSSCLQCRAIFQSGAETYCLLIRNFIVSKWSTSDYCDLHNKDSLWNDSRLIFISPPERSDIRSLRTDSEVTSVIRTLSGTKVTPLW